MNCNDWSLPARGLQLGMSDECDNAVNPNSENSLTIQSDTSGGNSRAIIKQEDIGNKTKTLSGTWELSSCADFDFEAQRRLFHNFGYAKSPDNPDKMISAPSKPLKSAKKVRVDASDPANIDGFLGPWAGNIGERKGIDIVSAPTEEEISKFVNEKSKLAPSTLLKTIELGNEYSVFHGKEERDYLGNTYMHSSFDQVNTTEMECYAPKKEIHQWHGHTKGVNSIKFIPKTAHLLLSAAQDQRIKLWNVNGERDCLRTFYGHNKPIREVTFDSDGKHFASCSFDKTFKYWDTETGRCLLAKDHRGIPYCATFHPDGNVLMVGTSDRKVLQVDLRTGEQVLEYTRHHDAVNTITFINDGQSFVTSGDDKCLRVWDYGSTKYKKIISDPSLHSIPSSSLHPTLPFIAFQSLSNRILVYSLHDNLTLHPKSFIGHSTGGYPCQIGFSPDGKYIYSGDSRGQVVIWSWESMQIVRRIEAHKQVCIGVQWNPIEKSRIASCSWDGSIKYWE